ncbi:protein translocase subunit SecD [Beggiatoa leptomitoformis]|uniref:Protein translocase subunit SecD n=1 Tax=Beggiatoa leptomitoformis TaxID=288004 RepID=A0A2N9YGH7_9GAMM|nr:protein translocase subunit SecD [Beggiatoa leptomitoformis]ALG68106.1 protein translocase subunit SecD [Beggiatoa leptomitoformis]AUI69597.1 protein translocase subunit SecD [Beggiatoa leptomitoformis]
MNQYPLWKYILIGVVIFIGSLFALPNLFGEDPAIQISPPYARNVTLDDTIKQNAETALKGANLSYFGVELTPERLLIRFANTDTQLKAYSVLTDTMKGYIVAQNLAPATPAWLSALGAKPMYLGLDLRGGVHFLMQVDMKAAIQQDEEIATNDMRTLFRGEKLRYQSLSRIATGGIEVVFPDTDTRDKARQLIQKDFTDLIITEKDTVDSFGLRMNFNEKAIKTRQGSAVEQNITTLRNRINELGVAEPVIQQQGTERIVVQLPGVQDTARAKEILGATATLEFRLVEGTPSEWAEAQRSNKIPLNARLYDRRDGSPILLKRNVIVTGDQISGAAATIDQRSGSPAASVKLNSKGADRMFETTRENVGKPMAVVFIEYKTESTKGADGQEIKTRRKVEEVINVATIQEAFGKSFQITGLGSGEAHNLALLLRAGALKAPMEIVEERTVGPSLGQENITQGFLSITIAFIGVLIFMAVRYHIFGIVANVALLMNVVLLIALLSMIQATLTLPGLAGIVLTLGMAVDANVLIYERIREELHNGNSPQASIHAGFDKAFATIADSNITTLIAGIVLFSFGTGPIKGFAVVLCLGILTSMFTAIMISRAVINYFYGGKKLTTLPV